MTTAGRLIGITYVRTAAGARLEAQFASEIWWVILDNGACVRNLDIYLATGLPKPEGNWTSLRYNGRPFGNHERTDYPTSRCRLSPLLNPREARDAVAFDNVRGARM